MVLQSVLRPLTEPSHLVGRHIGPFLIGLESGKAGRPSLAQEMFGGKETVLRESQF